MEINPLQFVGALLSAGLVLAVVHVRQSRQFSVRALLAVVTIVAIVLGVIGFALRR
jgi:hypothetical protein